MAISKNIVVVSLFASCFALTACGNSKDEGTGNGGTSTVIPSTGGTTFVESSVGGSSAVVSAIGTVGSGGTVSSSNGGTASSKGGASSTGGTVAKGGASSTGGTVAKGGTSATGSTSAKGGTHAGTGGSGGTQNATAIRTRTITTRGFTFDVRESGSSGEPVLLLHGFPDTSLEWNRLMPVLSANGYRCLAPDQRGYSPGARPTEVDAYKYEELVADAFAFGSELGERFHVVAHDWGANIAWLMVEKDPSRIASFTAISIPHYQVWARSVYDDPAMAGYLSMLNTWMTVGKGEDYWTPAAMRSMWKAKPADETETTIAHMTEPGAMTAALNWYRASRGHKSVIEDFEAWTVNVPTLLIHGSTDLGERALTDTAALMKGPYRVVRPKGGHFIVDEQPQAVADETLAHLKAYPISK